jgi:hypothetical protein
VAGLGGLLQGLSGTPGPPIVLYYYAGPDSAAVNRHQLIGFFTLLDAAGLALFGWHGTLDPVTLARIAVLIPLSAAGTWLGGHLFHQAGEALLRRMALALVAGVGLFALLY